LFAAQKEECGVRKLLLNDGARSRAPEQLFTDEAGGWVGGRAVLLGTTSHFSLARRLAALRACAAAV